MNTHHDVNLKGDERWNVMFLKDWPEHVQAVPKSLVETARKILNPSLWDRLVAKLKNRGLTEW